MPHKGNVVNKSDIKFKFLTSNSNSLLQIQIHHSKFKFITPNSNSSLQIQIRHSKFKFLTPNSNFSLQIQIHHWSILHSSISYKVFSASNCKDFSLHHFGIDLYYSMVVFRVFCLHYVSDRASFTITKIEAYKKNFEQKSWSIMALKHRETGFTTLKELRASDFVYQHEFVLLLSYKINSKYTRITVTNYSQEI